MYLWERTGQWAGTVLGGGGGKGSYDVLQTKVSERKALNMGEGGKN